jgi:hypothetical protein
VPPGVADLLRLADVLCGAACEISNQQEPAASWSCPDGKPVPMGQAPKWAFQRLSEALNAYWEARHMPREAGRVAGMAPPPDADPTATRETLDTRSARRRMPRSARADPGHY